MAYIGPEPNPGQNREVDDISSGFNGSEVNFTLQVNSQNVSPGSSNNIIVSLGGVVQNPSTDYNIAASTITFTTAPASGLSFFGLVLGQQVDIQSVADSASIVSPTLSGPTVTGDLSIADKIVHTGDTNTAIRFPSADTITAETGGSERARITSAGSMVMTNASTTTFFDASTTSSGSNTRGVISVSGKTSADAAVTLKMGGFGDTQRGEIFTHSNHDLGFATNNSATQFKCKTSGNFEIVNGDLVVANGHGIDFSAQTTAGGNYTKDSELLDHYEEGTFTPSVSSTVLNSLGLAAFTDASFERRNGNYIKIGRFVHINAEIVMHASTRVFANGSGSTAPACITGCYPFARSTSSYPRHQPVAISFAGNSAFTSHTLYAQGFNSFNPPAVEITEPSSNGLSFINMDEAFPTGANIRISFSYLADA
jgi:hypothetical protein